MSKNNPRIRCVYANTERTLAELIEESFRLFLNRTFAFVHDVVSLSR